MNVVRVTARDLTGADGVTFVLKEGENVYYAEESAIGPLWKGKRFPASACISGWAMMNRCAAVIEDIYQDPRIPYDAYRATFVKSLVMMPVRKEDPIAAIGAYWADRHRATAEEVELLQTLSDASALALENAQLVANLEAAIASEHQARMEAETTNEAKDEWLSIISHELRTPLTPIFGWVRLLRSKRLDPSRLEDALEIIERNLDLHLALLDDLLDVSRMLSGKFEVKRTSIDFRDCVQRALDKLASTAERKSIEIHASLSDKPVPIMGDDNRVCQIAQNLIDNAIKFSDRDSKIDVSLKTREGEAEFVVADHGIGIDRDVFPLLFNRFRQADSSHTRSAGGLGLGLWIVRQLVDLHGGTVHAHSEGPDTGSVFTVRLPLS